jgi:acyl-CoA thioester hydrolase
VSLAELTAAAIGPVSLETTIRFHRELQAGDEIGIVSEFTYSDAKTNLVHQQLRRVDGALAAEVTSVSGLLDLNTRRLIPDPGGRWRAIAPNPGPLGL